MEISKTARIMVCSFVVRRAQDVDVTYTDDSSEMMSADFTPSRDVFKHKAFRPLIVRGYNAGRNDLRING